MIVTDKAVADINKFIVSVFLPADDQIMDISDKLAAAKISFCFTGKPRSDLVFEAEKIAVKYSL